MGESAEAKFKESRQDLTEKKSEVVEFLRQGVLDEKDRTRLTRVLQLVEKFSPAETKASFKKPRKTELSYKSELKNKALQFWHNFLQTAYRLLPERYASIIEERREQLLGDYSTRLQRGSAGSYLLAEETIKTLRELRHLDSELKREAEFPANDILNQEHVGDVESEETLDTSLTLEYEKKNWGAERIILDGIQNHLPSDSGGERIWIQCLVNNKWISLASARQQQEKVEAVRFVDDGAGFDVKNLQLLYSTKAGEEEPRGQFGEGLKMLSAASLREGMDIELESQNWRAKPIAKEVGFFDARHKKQQTAQQLAFQVEHLSGKPMIGSRTTFSKPTSAFLRELFKAEKKILPLRENYRPLFVSEKGQIVDREPGRIFVKGIQITTMPTLFSYNFNDLETNRDRNAIIEGYLVEGRIGSIIERISDKNLVKTLLKKSLLNPDAIESLTPGLPNHPDVWRDAFYEAFGDDAVVDTEFKIPGVLKKHPLHKVKFPSGITKLLLSAKAKADREVLPQFYEESIPTSLTLDYGKDIWNEERIILDAVQNHLPKDSGGTSIFLNFKTKDGQWHIYQGLEQFEDDQIEAIQIGDNGNGYDARLLGLLYSTKQDSGSTGKFGEGLKMLTAAGLRENVEIIFHSQNWIAKPRIVRQEISGKKIDQIVFDVTYATKEEDIEKLGEEDAYLASSTTFKNPSKKLIREFRAANKKILVIENPRPIETTKFSNILSLNEGLLYVRGILIPGDHSLLFSYHLPEFEIKDRDRGVIKPDELSEAIGKVLAETSDSNTIRQFLLGANRAAKQGGTDKIEFLTEFSPKHDDIWKKEFTDLFGEDTAIRDSRGEDFDEAHQLAHVGLAFISLPSMIFGALKKLGLPTYESRVEEMTDVNHLSANQLTEDELEVLDILRALDDYLPRNRSSDIMVYEPKISFQKVASGFSDGKSIHLLRAILSDMTRAADVYIHEKTHHNTGGTDASADFRNYLSLALAKLALEQLKELRPDLVDA